MRKWHYSTGQSKCWTQIPLLVLRANHCQVSDISPKVRFIRRISAESNAFEAIDNEMICFIIFCLNCIQRGRNATYEPGLTRRAVKVNGNAECTFRLTVMPLGVLNRIQIFLSIILFDMLITKTTKTLLAEKQCSWNCACVHACLI